MKTAVSLPDPLFKATQAAAKRLGITRSKLHQIALEEYLELLKSSEITRRLNESYSKHPELVDPFVQSLAEAAMHRLELEDEEGGNLVGKPRRTKRVRAGVPAARRYRVGK